AAAQRGQLAVRVADTPVNLKGTYELAGRAAGSVVLRAEVPSTAVRQWELSAPAVYPSLATLDDSASAHRANFGFRTIEIRDAQFLLNDQPMRWAGANRARGHPVHGGIDTDALVAQDMQLMKDAG